VPATEGREDSSSEPVVLVLHLLYPLLDLGEPQEGLARDSGFANSTSIFENFGHDHPDHEIFSIPSKGKSFCSASRVGI